MMPNRPDRWRIALVAVVLALLLGNGRSSAADHLLSQEALRRAIPGLQRPRLLTRGDLRSQEEHAAFDQYAYSFAIRSDFNRDNLPDVAIAGIDEAKSPGNRAFVAILTRARGGWVKSFLLWSKTDFAALDVKAHPDAARPQDIAVVARFTALPSGNYAVIYWDRSEYRVKTGFDLGD